MIVPKIRYCLILFVFYFFNGNKVQSQSYINFSKYAGGAGTEQATLMRVVNGETYILLRTNSANIAVTDGSIFRGDYDMVLSKYSNNGAVIFSKYLGGSGDEYYTQFSIIGNSIYISGYSTSPDIVTSNGTVFGGDRDLIIIKLNATTGALLFSTYLGGNGTDTPTYTLSVVDDNYSELQVVGNDIYIAGNTTSNNFPVTTGPSSFGNGDAFIAKLNGSTGAIIASRVFGQSNFEQLRTSFYENGFVYLVGITQSNNIPVTLSNQPTNSAQHIFVTKLNSADFSTNYCRYIWGNSFGQVGGIKIVNGIVHISGFTASTDFPVTNGTTASGVVNDLDGYYTRLNVNGEIDFSTYLSTPNYDFAGQIILNNNDVYLQASTAGTQFQTQAILIYKFNGSDILQYSRKFDAGDNVLNASYIRVLNNELFMFGSSRSPNFPVTNNSQYYGLGTGYFAHLDSVGNLVYSTFLGKMSAAVSMRYRNNQFYLLGTSNAATFTVTDSSNFSGSNDNLLIVLKPDGTVVYSGYTGGIRNDNASAFDVSNTDVFIYGTTLSANYPVTNNSVYQADADAYLTKIAFCPNKYDFRNDTISPFIQTVCKFGLAQNLIGKKISVPVDSLPIIYRDGIPGFQKPIEATYQWQIANSINGPFTNIPTATFKDFRPVIGGVNQYYRRLTFANAFCGASLIHTSDTAVVLVNGLTAPTINGGGTFNTCPGFPVRIGGSPTVSGGNLPYTSLQWDMGAGIGSNPIVAPTASTIYTLIVTDNLGCQQIGQSIVFTYAAFAGSDKSSCAGVPVKIGGTPASGVPGIVYNWQPGTGLTSTSVAQPFSNPSNSTEYFLTLTVPVTGGGTCQTKDTVVVLPVAGPVTNEIAGPDKVICLGDVATIGNPPEIGFNYIWTPGSYISDNTTATTTYNPGNLLMPLPNPAFVNLTAQKDGCSFKDMVEVATIESKAGRVGCGPRYVGSPDRTPQINETYQWTLVSGPGNFTGVTNEAQVPVSASVGGASVYGLTVTYNGGSCYSEVLVPDTCYGCDILFFVSALYECPSYSVNGGNVQIEADGSLDIPGPVTYSWQPQAGLSNYNTNLVQLTDNVPRTYVFTIRSAVDTSVFCSRSINVNDPSFSAPVFPAPDIIACSDSIVFIGLPNVAGYMYEWEGVGLSDNFISNPAVALSVETSFPVEITDASGCVLKDTVTVRVQNINVNAGPDWVVCNNAVVQLGTPPQPFTTYVWEPQLSPWQNGTNQFSPQPQVLAAADITFTVTATTSAGCVTTDEVSIVINNTPAIADYGDVLICAGNSIQIGNPALPGVQYQWVPAAGLSDPTVAQPLANPVTNTIYTLNAIFPGSCALPATDQVNVTVSNPAFNMPDIAFCPSNGPIQLGAAAPSGMILYQWEPQQLVSNSSIANPTTLNPPPNDTTSFVLLLINSNGCSARDSITITPTITAPLAGIDKTICIQSSTSIGSIANTTGPGITYSWNPITNLSNAASPNPVFSGTTAGVFTYILTKTNISTSCSSKDTVVLTVAGNVLPSMISPVVCRNSCIQIGTNPIVGITYQWSPANGLSNATVANPVACVDSVTTVYNLTATDLNGCSTSGTVSIGVNQLPAAQISIPAVTACVGDINVILNPVINPPGNYSYSWTPDNGTLSNVNIANPTVLITGVGTTQYTLQVTNTVSGCTSTAVATVNTSICPDLTTIGDFMWFDNNSNGLQEAGEPGVSNMLVKLYNNLDINLVTTFTNANGYYSFTGIAPGSGYYVVFNKPTGYSFTIQNVGGITANNNSKADVNGRSNDFNVATGITLIDVDAGIRPTGATPVTLLSFTGTLRNNQVLLNWQTTAEYNNDYFEVQKSQDGLHFNVIGTVDGNGTTSLPSSYYFVDRHPFNGRNFYRLRQVDVNGNFSYSSIIQITIGNNQVYTAYYNPASQSIVVLFDKPQLHVAMALYANNGQLLKKESINGTTNFIMKFLFLANAVYVLVIETNEFTATEKIVIR